MNRETYMWFLQTASGGVESHIQCEGKLWIKEHLSFPAALNFAVLQNWIVDEDYVGVATAKLQFGWSKAIHTSPAELKMLDFRSEGILFPQTVTAANS